MALLFGNSGDRVDHGSGATLDNLPAAAFYGWTWIYKTDIGGQQCLITKDNAYPSGWMFLIDGATATGLLRFIIFRGSNFADATDFRGQTLDVVNNEWTFVGFSFDPAASPRVKIYRGKLDVAVAEIPSYSFSSAGTGTASDDAAASLYVGNDQRNNSLVFKGAIAGGEVGVGTFSQSQFESRRRSSLANIGGASTKLLFNYESLSTLSDLSGNGNNGTATGAANSTHPPFFSITTASLPNVAAGAAYNQTIACIRGLAPYTNARITAGSMPSGWSIVAENGLGNEVCLRITGTAGGISASNTFTVAVDDDDGKTASRQFTINTTSSDSTAPTIPANLNVAQLTSGSNRLTWNASSDVGGGVTGYGVRRATNAGFTTGVVDFPVGNLTTYDDTTAVANTQYWYKVNAHDAIPNTSGYSTAKSILTLPAWEGSKTFAYQGYYGLAAEDNFVHVISGGFDEQPIYYYRSSDEGATWGIDGVQIAVGLPYLEDPLVVQNGKIALFYFKNLVTIRDFFTPSPNPPRVVGELYCSVSVNNGANWQTEKLVSGVVVPGRGIRMSACWDAAGILHATWMDFKNVANPQDPDNQTTGWDLYYNRSLNNGVTWETEQRLAISSNRTGENRPSIVALGNTVHITWFRGIDGKGSCFIDGGTTLLPNCTEVFHQRNLSNGVAGSWETRNQLTENLNPILYSGRVESVAIAPSTLLITFDRGLSPAQGGAQNDIYGIRSINNGQSFQTEFPIVIRPGAQTHSGTAYRDGRTHLVWGSYPNGGDNTIYYIQSLDDGASYGVPEVVTNGIVGLLDTTDNYVHCVGGTTYRRRLLQPIPEPPPPPPPIVVTPSFWTNAGLVSKKDLESWLALDNSTNGSEIIDYSGNNRHVLSLSPTLQENVLAGKPALYFNGTDEPLIYNGSINARHIFCVLAYEDALFDNYRGIISDTHPDRIGLIGNTGTANFFYDVDKNGLSYRKRDVIFPQTNMNAPISANFAVVELLYPFQVPWTALQIGQDRNFTDRRWKGWFVESLIFSTPKNECERLDIYKYFAMKFFLWRQSSNGLNIFPLPNNHKTNSTAFKNSLESTSISGAYKGRSKSALLHSFDAQFTIRRAIEWDAAERFWDEHSNGVRCVLEDNSFYPRRQFEGRITTALQRNPESINNIGYQFGFVTS